mgnify:CR=1 FL=1
MGFQVPRVTIKIDFKEGASFGELSLISFGYGLHQAWIYSSMFDKGGIFGTGGLQAGPFNDQLSLAYFVSILIYGLLLLLAALRFGIVKLEQVKEVGLFLTGIFPLLFVPAAAGVMELWAEMGNMLLPIIIAIIPVTVLVMVSAGRTTQALTSRRAAKKEAEHD